MVELKPSKLMTGIRFPADAPVSPSAHKADLPVVGIPAAGFFIRGAHEHQPSQRERSDSSALVAAPVPLDARRILRADQANPRRRKAGLLDLQGPQDRRVHPIAGSLGTKAGSR